MAAQAKEVESTPPTGNHAAGMRTGLDLFNLTGDFALVQGGTGRHGASGHVPLSRAVACIIAQVAHTAMGRFDETSALVGAVIFQASAWASASAAGAGSGGAGCFLAQTI